MSAVTKLTRSAELAPALADGGTLDILLPLHVVIDPSGLISRSGPTAPRLLKRESLVGLYFFDLVTVLRPRGISDLAGLLRHAGAKLSVEIAGLDTHRLKGVAVPAPGGQGAIVDLSLGAGVQEVVSARNLRNKDFSPADPTVEMLWLLGAQGIFMAESKRLNRHLEGKRTAAEAEAYTDSLSGLPNRRALERQLARMLRRRPRGGVALMQIDLDHFKQVNDTLGHAAGDHVLKEVSQRLLDVIRPTDMVARIGGDEFVVVLSDYGCEATLSEIGHRIIAAVSEPMSFEGQPCRVGASVGASIVEEEASQTVETILSDADRALYLSKEQGRGRYNLFSDSVAP